MRKITLLKSRLDRSGGAEKYARRLIRAFLDAHCSVHLLTSGPQQLSPHPKLHVETIPSQSLFSVTKVRRFDQFCSDRTKKLSHPVFGLDRNSFQTHLRASNGAHASYLLRRRSVSSSLKGASFTLNPLHRTLLQMERKALTHPLLQTVIVNSHLVKNEMLTLYPLEEEKIQVIHNGVEWDESQEAFACWEREKQNHLARAHLSNTPYYFLFMGHDFQRKGLSLLLKGLALIPDPHVHLLVVGNDPKQSHYERLCSRLHLTSRVHFMGPSDNPIPWYQCADALVIPSLYDPFANVTVEALAMGLFVVSSSSNGGCEVLKPHTGTILSSLTDPDAMAEGLRKALQRPKTPLFSEEIRHSVAHLEFAHQLKQVIECVLS